MGQPAAETSHSAGYLPLAAIALAALLWAVAAVVARDLFDSGVPPIQLVEARAVLSAAGLALLPAAWRRARAPKRGEIRWAIALGVSIALVNAAYYSAISRLAVAVAIVLQYLGPGVVVAWSAFARRRRPSNDVLVAVTVAFIGIVFVSELPAGDLGTIDALGILAGLASAVFFAAYTVQSERAANIYGPMGALLRAFAAASVLWIVYQAPQGLPSELIEPDNIAKVLFVGFVGTLAPFLLYIWAVERIRAERAVIAATLEPLFAGVVAWAWLGQVLSLLQIAGGALILGAVVSLQLSARRVAPATPSAPPPG